MNNKLQKVMTALKGRHQQKEQKVLPGSEGPFNPKHGKQTHGEEPNSPNNVKEAASVRLAARKNPNILNKIPSERNRLIMGRSNQGRSLGSYTEQVLLKMKKMREENNNNTTGKAKQKTSSLGTPDTGGSNKGPNKGPDTITINPGLPETIIQSR